MFCCQLAVGQNCAGWLFRFVLREIQICFSLVKISLCLVFRFVLSDILICFNLVKICVAKSVELDMVKIYDLFKRA